MGGAGRFASRCDRRKRQPPRKTGEEEENGARAMGGGKAGAGAVVGECPTRATTPHSRGHHPVPDPATSADEARQPTTLDRDGHAAVVAVAPAAGRRENRRPRRIAGFRGQNLMLRRRRRLHLHLSNSNNIRSSSSSSGCTHSKCHTAASSRSSSNRDGCHRRHHRRLLPHTQTPAASRSPRRCNSSSSYSCRECRCPACRTYRISSRLCSRWPRIRSGSSSSSSLSSSSLRSINSSRREGVEEEGMGCHRKEEDQGEDHQHSSSNNGRIPAAAVAAMDMRITGPSRDDRLGRSGAGRLSW
jgi:hypothetical protein